MGLLGAIFGGTLGFVFMGPIGAILGTTLGGSIGASQVGGARIGNGQSNAEVQTAFMVALISLAAKTAKADGQVTPDEVDTLDRFLVSQGMNQEDRQRAAQIFNEARDSNIEANQFARQIGMIAGGNRELLMHLVTILLQIAFADRHLHPAEDKLIAEVASEMGLSPADLATCRARFSSTSEPRPDNTSAYKVLGLDPDASMDEVKAAYRRLAKEYHPDRIQSHGLPEDFMVFAKEKFQAINGAYEQIKKAQGA